MSKVTAPPSMLIGLAGPAGVGKTTIAESFELGLGFKILTFAAPLKQSLSVLTGLSPKYFNKIELKEKMIPGLNDSPRTLMQKFGTEFVREMVHPEFWIWRMRNTISKYSHRHIIIDDVRFNNEAGFIRGNGGVMIHLDRVFDSPTEHTEHTSETPVTQYANDYLIYGTNVRETYNQCVTYMKMFYKYDSFTRK